MKTNLIFQNELKDITKMTQDMKEHKSDFKKTQNTLRNKVTEPRKALEIGKKWVQ